MIAIKKALRAKLIGDATLVALLGGQFVYQRRPPQEPKKSITIWRVSGMPHPEIPHSDELYQIDVWTETSDEGDTILERVVAILAPIDGTKATLPALTGRRLDQITHVGPVIEDEDETGLQHKATTFRITSYPS